MYNKIAKPVVSQIAESEITKDERYELIALIAQRYRESGNTRDIEEQQIWDTNDTEIDFNDVVSHF